MGRVVRFTPPRDAQLRLSLRAWERAYHEALRAEGLTEQAAEKRAYREQLNAAPPWSFATKPVTLEPRAPRLLRQPPPTWRTTLVAFVFGLATLAAIALCWAPVILVWRLITGANVTEDQRPTTDKTGVKTTTQQALDDFAAQLLKHHEQQIDPTGHTRLVLPLAQMFLDVAVVQMKLEAIFEELGAEQLIDPAKLAARLLQKLERETQQLKAANADKTRLAVAHAIHGVNGRGNG